MTVIRTDLLGNVNAHASQFKLSVINESDLFSFRRGYFRRTQCFHLTDARIEGLSERNGEYAWTRANKEIDSYLRLPEAEHYLVHGGENPFRSGVLELEDVRYL